MFFSVFPRRHIVISAEKPGKIGKGIKSAVTGNIFHGTVIQCKHLGGVFQTHTDHIFHRGAFQIFPEKPYKSAFAGMQPFRKKGEGIILFRIIADTSCQSVKITYRNIIFPHLGDQFQKQEIYQTGKSLHRG
jgi:hypothetical protein